jgi:hypothetical protein
MPNTHTQKRKKKKKQYGIGNQSIVLEIKQVKNDTSNRFNIT